MTVPTPLLSRLLLLCVLAAGAVASAQAGEVQWRKEKFNYTAKGKDLKELLREFAASQGLTAVVSKEVEGTVNGKFSLLPESLMELMAASFGFIWYAEGNVIFVTPASDMASEVIRLNNVNVSHLRQALEQLDLPTRRFPIIYDTRQGTALASGPGRYVKLVAQTARSVDRVQGAPGDMSVRVIPLRFAWAADLTYTQGGRDLTIPGVASVLTQLYGGNGAVPRLAPRIGGRTRSSADLARSLGFPGVFQRPAGDDAAVPMAPSPLSPMGERAGPQFVPDGRLNAVIVRDRPELMAEHEATIKALDVKPGLVEIEVQIIEVNTEAVETLGIDWRLRSGRADLQLGRGNLPSMSWGTALSDRAPATGPNGPQAMSPPPNGILTTVLGDSGRHLIARVNALAQDGKANILSSPKLMTLDNVEAVLENLNTFFVKVAGNLDVNLFDVSVGTTLRVTPLIVAHGETQQVKLAIRIEDGAVTSEKIDLLPVIRRSSITTQSLVGSNQALLIAGYAQETDSNDGSGVPGLSSIPYLGRLFKYTDKRRSKVERLFLLTPRIASVQ